MRRRGLALYCRNSLYPSLLPVTPPQGMEILCRGSFPPLIPITPPLCYCVSFTPIAVILIDLIIENMDKQRARYSSVKVIVCSDFNQLNNQELEQQLIITQVIDFPTHGNNILHLILTDLT